MQRNSCRLVLPNKKGLHLTCEIFVLRRSSLSEKECKKKSPSSYKLAKDPFTIEKIISHVGYPGKRKFLVKFKFMEDSENQWKDEEELKKYQNLVRNSEIEHARGRARN